MNRLVLIQKSDTESIRHGGRRQYRHFELWLNRVLIECFDDDHAWFGYATGRDLDHIINDRLSKFEKALGVVAERIEEEGRVKLIEVRQ